MQFVLKVIISAVIITVISIVSKKAPLFGAIIASLPLTSILAMIWLYKDTQNVQQVIGLSDSIFWMVIPSLIFFVALSILMKNGLGFWISLGGSCFIMIISYAVYIKVLSIFNILI